MGLCLAATTASFILVERPIRRRGMLLGYRLTPRRLVAVVPLASGLVAAVILVATASGDANPAWDTAGVAAAGASTVPAAAVTTPRPATASPDPGAGSYPPGASPQATSRATTIHTVGVVGDSVTVSALPGLQAEASARGWTFVAAAASGCPVALQPLFDDQGNPSPFNDGCRSVAGLHDQLVAARPDVVIWEDLQSVLSRRAPDGTLLLAGSPAWTADLLAGWTAELDRISGSGATVVLVMPPERSQQAPGCRDVPQEARCVDLQRQDSIIRAATTAFWSTLAGRPGIRFVRVDSLLCPDGTPCPTSMDGINVRISGWDQTHFTAAGARWYAPRLFDLVVTAVGQGS